MAGTEMLSIGDVSKLFDIPVHTIRYWEKEFAQELVPRRTQGKQRRYSHNDIMQILNIKTLLWDKGYSIKAARTILSGMYGYDPVKEKAHSNPNTGISGLSEMIVQNLTAAV